jgi:hypothetical protein
MNSQEWYQFRVRCAEWAIKFFWIFSVLLPLFIQGGKFYSAYFCFMGAFFSVLGIWVLDKLKGRDKP